MAHGLRFQSCTCGHSTYIQYRCGGKGADVSVLCCIAGDSLKDVKYAMTEDSTADMPKKNNATFEEIGLQYLSDWEARGFAIHLCNDKSSCFDTPSTPAKEAVSIARDRGILNALMVPSV